MKSTEQKARYAVVGADYHSADSGFRDRLYVDEESKEQAFVWFRQHGVAEAAILSTCDRTEIHLASNDIESAVSSISDWIAEKLGMSKSRVQEQTYRRYDEDAVDRVFRICSALESQIIGESQVLGQVKESVDQAKQHGMIGPELDALYQSAVAAAKAVRTETAIGRGAVSVASIVSQLTRDLHGDLSQLRGLVIGLGDTGQLIMQVCRDAGLAKFDMTGTSRRTERAALAADCHFVPIADLEDAVVEADLVISAVGSGRYTIDRNQVQAALKARRARPILFVDCGVPVDVDPAVDRLDEAFLYTLADLEKLARSGMADREEAAVKARGMVTEAVAAFRRAKAEQESVPSLVAMRRHFDDMRRHVLSEHAGADANEATRLLVNHLLHQPSQTLRRIAGDGESADIKDMITVNRVLNQLFGLNADEGRSPEEGDISE